MRVNKLCQLLLALVLFCLPSTAHAQMCKGEDDGSNAQQAYAERRKELFSSLKEVRHLMISGPAVRDTIDIKDAMREIHNLQNEYAQAKTNGTPLTALADRYFELLGKVDTLHNQLYERIEPASTRANDIWRTIRENYPDLMTADKADYEAAISETREYVKPVNIGVERLDEFRDEAIKELIARREANPELNLTAEVQQDILRAAALTILDRRIATPEGTDACCP
jgi:hypothetical protein